MVKSTQEASAQDACPLFKLAPETRNQIYSLVFAAETKQEDDESIELVRSTASPSKGIIMTCQLIRHEAQAMYKAVYRAYPEHVFTLDIPCRWTGTFIPSLNNDIFSRIKIIRATFQAGERAGVMNRFTAHFTRVNGPRLWDIQVEMHDQGGRTARTVQYINRYFEAMALKGQMAEQQYKAARCPESDEMLSYAFSRCAFFALYVGRDEESLWR
jgi:hypothetical protein